jgi:hypothetical protein
MNDRPHCSRFFYPYHFKSSFGLQTKFLPPGLADGARRSGNGRRSEIEQEVSARRRDDA